MQFTEGQQLVWVPDAKWDKPAPVKVEGLRKGGRAVLSNGWCVDEDGVAEGTGRVQGGRVLTPEQFNAAAPGCLLSEAESSAAIERLRACGPLLGPEVEL